MLVGEAGEKKGGEALPFFRQKGGGGGARASGGHKIKTPSPPPPLPAYLAALAFYLWVRITKTLNLGAYTWYGGLVLAVEILGATTVLLYGTNLVIAPAPPPPPKLDVATGAILVEDAYHVRVVVPCYKESLVRGSRGRKGG